MDAKITKKRLGEFLSYEWIKVVAIAAVIMIVFSLLFSMTSARLTVDQVFTVFNYTGTTAGEDFNNYSSLLLGNKALSYEVNEVSVMDITVNNNSMSGTLLETRITTGEGDVLYAADAPYEGKSRPVVSGGNLVKEMGESGEEEIKMETSTYLYEFLISKYNSVVMPIEDVTVQYGGVEYTIEGILTVTSNYLSNYFTKTGDTFSDDTIDAAKAESDFRARVAETADKRFRKGITQADIDQEIARLQQYRVGYNTFISHLDADKIVATESSLVFSDESGNPMVVTGKYSLNLCPGDNPSDSWQSAAYYYEKDGDNQPVKTAKNLNLVFLDLEGSRREFVGEKLLFVNYLVDRHYGK